MITIGLFTYMISYSCASLGFVSFPVDDHKHFRTLHVCNTIDVSQKEQVAEHELLHICMHDHVHSYILKEQLQKHLDTLHAEEPLIDTIAPCMIENRASIRKVFGLPNAIIP